MSTKAEQINREQELKLAEVSLFRDLFGYRLAEHNGNIYWQRQFKNRFDSIAAEFEQSQDADLKNIAVKYRGLMFELNVGRGTFCQLKTLAYLIGA